MKERTDFVLEEKGLEGGRESDAACEAMEAIKRARKVVDLLEEAFELIFDDDPTQPATKYVHAALFEAEHRADVLEEGYRTTFAGRRGADQRGERQGRYGRDA